eukprot:TRINITY_DN9327_c0_g1_i1.p1 TRINITY_DN9327_c0_g1~~TRINITY_DN9327_c0_g1_i1.p1  ORF type:complete len:596 (-),score=143.86 TRINITY_DN9327_c0_g1_i1:24-1772(-)
MSFALLSVFNKENIGLIATTLVDAGYQLLSTGGTYNRLSEEGLQVQSVSDITQFPEILGGRVKSLHPKIHGGAKTKAMSFALLSVFNKENIGLIATTLVDAGYQLLSTGGTYNRLSEEGLQVQSVSDITQFPEILGGRVKSLHPKIHGGILSNRSEEHNEELKSLEITNVDVVVCNLYPFVQVVNTSNNENDAIENIDIGGVAMLRAAAKNYKSVVVICDPDDYQLVSDELQNGGVSLETRKKLALKAFKLTASYDTAISNWMSQLVEEEPLPEEMTFSIEEQQSLRYGENPHQAGKLYKWKGQEYPFQQIQGLKDLSYNNILDIEAAWSTVLEFEDPAVVIIKHNTPCGVAVSQDGLLSAYEQALASDPVSAFGSIIAVNREVTLPLIKKIGKLFLEVLVAESFTEGALKRLKKFKKNTRIIQVVAPTPPTNVIKSVYGGVIIQEADKTGVDMDNWKTVTEAQPTDEMKQTLAFAWLAVKHSKSNAIVLCQNQATVGIGCGQPNRIDSVRNAIIHAGDQVQGSVLASDAFFPFSDGVEEAGNAGVVAVVQPGGSVNDQEVIDKCNELGLVMMFTGERHFLH